MTRVLPRRATSSLLLCLPLTVLAHAGHHHGDEAPAAPATPPATASTAQVEVVAQRDHADVVIYVDDYATNAPLSGLRLGVHSGAGVVQAAPDGEGSYRIPADLAGAGPGSVQVEIEGAGIHLVQTVDLPEPAPAVAAPPAQRLPVWTVAALLAPPLALAIWLLRRRSRAAPAPSPGAA
jgi:cobalt-zinc-cadmium efflux system membrane fusion protein